MAKDELDNIAGRISDADDLDEDMLDRLDDASSASDVDDQVPEVIRAVTTADDGERRRLIDQIDEMEASARARVEKGLVEAVEDGGRQERIAAAQALAEVGGEASIEALEDAADEDDGEVSEAAADALESVRERTGASEDGEDGG
ncbi:MAG: HEAT repeat domain-containing protein, partial [Halobacteriota archaeon]